MSTETTTGGFIGDPAEAFHPPATSGCCGAPAVTNAEAAPCCGSAEAASAADACCAPAAKAEAVDAGAGCCG